MKKELHHDIALALHLAHNGKVEINSKLSDISFEDFAYLYTPYVAEVCRAIIDNPKLKYDLTSIGNTIAIITNGTRILGLGNISEAGHPVMEGKSLLFKILGGVDAYPLSINAPFYKDIVQFVKMLQPSISGVNLEDIKQPDAFLAWKELQNLSIPVFHDDMEGTAIVLMAGLINATRVVKKDLSSINVVFVGGGSAGLGFAMLWKDMDLPKDNITFIDRKGVISTNREDISNNPVKSLIASLSSGRGKSIIDAVQGADAIIGASSPGAIKPSYIKQMNDKPIVFAVSNPTPEIFPDEALKAGAFITATGRSDFPNQLNNSLVFPSIFRGTLSARATKITQNMKKAAVYALADSIVPTKDRIIPRMDNKYIYQAVAIEVVKAAIKDNVANVDYEEALTDISKKLGN